MEKKNKEKHSYLTYILIVVLIIFISLLVFKLITTNVYIGKTIKDIKQENLRNYPKDKPIQIGVVWPFFLDKDDNYFKEGVLLALEEINKKKVLGRTINALFEDDKWDVDVAQNIAKKFATNEDIVAVIAHDDIELAIPASISYEYSGTIMISPAVSHPLFTRMKFDYIFRNTPSDIMIGEALANIASLLNYRKIIILNSRDTYSETLTKIFTKKAMQNGINIMYSNKFHSNEENFLNILTDISPQINKTIDYDAIFIAGDEINVPLFIKNARKKGIYAPFLTGDILDSPALLEIGEDAENTLVATIYNEELLNTKMQNFINLFRKTYDKKPDTWAAQGYDAIMLLAQTIEKVGSLDSSLIATQLKYTKQYDSIFGEYSLNERGDVIDREIHFKIVKNNKFSYLDLK